MLGGLQTSAEAADFLQPHLRAACCSGGGSGLPDAPREEEVPPEPPQGLWVGPPGHLLGGCVCPEASPAQGGPHVLLFGQRRLSYADLPSAELRPRRLHSVALLLGRVTAAAGSGCPCPASRLCRDLGFPSEAGTSAVGPCGGNARPTRAVGEPSAAQSHTCLLQTPQLPPREMGCALLSPPPPHTHT